MAYPLPEVDVFSSTVVIPQDGDDATEASILLPFQSLTNRTRNLDGRATFNQSNITALDNRLEIAEADIDALEVRATAAEGQIGGLQLGLASAEADIDVAQASLVSLDGRLDAAEAELNGLPVFAWGDVDGGGSGWTHNAAIISGIGADLVVEGGRWSQVGDVVSFSIWGTVTPDATSPGSIAVFNFNRPNSQVGIATINAVDRVGVTVMDSCRVDPVNGDVTVRATGGGAGTTVAWMITGQS